VYKGRFIVDVTTLKAREESFLVPAKAGAHSRQAQLFHQVSMSVVDVDHLNRTMDLLYTARGESFLIPAKAGAHARQAQLFHQVSKAE
jgi:phosphotransferase system HPr-like phosphotransfer protein